jgi:hypothetical protein
MLGTPHYLSPEQVSGEQATAASDFYALGVVAYECLTGRRPFEGEAIAVLLAQRDQPAPPLPQSVPVALRELVTAMLDKDFVWRPTDGRAIAAQAERLGEPAPTQQPPAPLAAAYPAEPVASPSTAVFAAPEPPRDVAPVAEATREGRSPRVPGWMIAAALAVACLLAIVAIVVTHSGSSPSPKHAAAKPAPLKPVHVAAVTPYAVGGASADHPEEAPLAADGDASTSWFTQHYATGSFGSLRSGAGLVFDLGKAVDVKRLTLRLPVNGVAVQVHAGSSVSSLLSEKTIVSSSSASSSLVAHPGVTARYWLVWFTRLGPSDGAFRAGVAEALFAR